MVEMSSRPTGWCAASRGEPASAQVVDYLQKAMALDSSDRIKALLFYFDYLDHRDQKVSTDAYLEFSRASDAESSARSCSTSKGSDESVSAAAIASPGERGASSGAGP